MADAYSSLGVSGPAPAPLLPEQARFLERGLPNPHHWNVSQFYSVPPTLTTATLRDAFRRVVARHDALRVRLHSPGVQVLRCDDRFDVGERDTSDLTPDEFGAFVTADAQALHRAFVLTRGPLIRCVHYPHPVMPRVLLLAHHFIVDQIGGILLETELDAELRHAAARPQCRIKTRCGGSPSGRARTS
jgi:condensation domain-containing protein